jgi:predicted nucleic acid-binding protein
MGTLRWYFDISVPVPAAVLTHPHNGPALAILEELVKQKHQGFVSAHSLTEFYPVLTRTPFKPPIYPSEAWDIIGDMVLPHMQLVTLTAKEHQDVVRDCAANGWAGGKIHDAVHLRCAQKAECDRVYTFNVKDFRSLASSILFAKISSP